MNYKDQEKNKKNKKARKKGRLNFLLKIFGGFLLFGIVALVIIAAMFEKQIAEMVIKTLNKQLKTELTVSDASLSLIWQFPQAAVYLHDAKIDGVGGQEEKLLDVGSISLHCGLFGLLMGNYSFTSIEIKNGSLFVYSDKNGKVNYDIFKSTGEESTEGSDLSLAISNASLTNLTLHYVDQASAYDVKIIASTADFEGDFIIDNELNRSEHTLTSNAELYFDHVTVGETSYLIGKEFAYDGAIDLDLAKERYTFQEIKLYVQGNEFNVDGTISKVEKGTDYNIVFDSDKALLGSMMQLVPEQFASTIGQFESNGNLTFDARVNGVSSKRSAPIIEVNFGLKNGRVTHPSLVGSMKNVNFDVHFTNGNGIDDKTAKLDLIGFQASINDEPINATWEMTGLENPMISMSVDGNIPLSSVYKFFGDQVTEGSGLIEVATLSLQGKLQDMTSMYRIPRVKLGGQINFNQAHLVVNEISTNIESGSLILDNNVFKVGQIAIKTAASDILLNGDFQNVLPVLLSDSLNSQNAKLTFQSSLTSQKMDIDELLAIASGRSTEDIEEAPEEEQDSLIKETYQQREYQTSFLDGTFVTNIAEIKYGKVLAQKFKGEVEFKNSAMSLKQVQINAMGGVFELNSKVYFEKEPRVELFLDCNDIDIQEFLLQFDNFGQEVLTSDNIRGKLKSLIKINLFMDSLGNFKHDDLFVVADVKITDGELINLKMLESFSSFIKLRDLQQITFTELKNQFKIVHGQFHMPAMFIQSNALNLLIGGKYNFNHDMDFKLKINVGQILASKFKKYNPEKPAIKARKKGLFNIYAHIFGNLYGDYQYKLGPKHSKKYLEAQLIEDLPVIANTLREEFYKTTGGAGKEPIVEDLKEPEDWGDIPEFEGQEGEDEEYIEGF
jgi:hypothetical protein